MKRITFVASVVLTSAYCNVALAQTNGDPAYQKLRKNVTEKFRSTPAGEFNSPLSRISTQQKFIALTFDACGGPTGSGYDEELIRWLQQEKIPATLFLSGRWIDVHTDLVKQLSKDPLFEIENHGLLHRPCSVTGQSKYKVAGTRNVEEVVDEIELNAEKIQKLTGRKPIYYRPATAYSDQACKIIAKALGETVINYSVLSGDAVAGTPAASIEQVLVGKSTSGSIIIMHMNRPDWNGWEALKAAIPQLRDKGYSFVQLQRQTIVSK